MELRIVLLIPLIFLTYSYAFADVDFIKTQNGNLPTVDKSLLNNIHSKSRVEHHNIKTDIANTSDETKQSPYIAITNPSPPKKKSLVANNNKHQTNAETVLHNKNNQYKDNFINNEVKILLLPEASVVLNKVTRTGKLYVMDPQQTARYVIKKLDKDLAEAKGKAFMAMLQHCNKNYNNNFNRILHKQIDAKQLLYKLKAEGSSHEIISVLYSYPELFNTYIDNQNMMLWALYSKRYFLARNCYLQLSKIPLDSDWFIRNFFILAEINKDYDEFKYLFFNILQKNINISNFISK